MFLWSMQVNIECKTTPEKAWKVLSTVSSWNKWNHDVQWALLNGPFSVGSTGVLKPLEYHEVPFRISHFEKNRALSITIKKFLTSVVCTFRLDCVGNNKTLICQRIVVGGLFAPILRRTWAKKLKRRLPLAIYSLRDLL